ncbi:MAG: hypothetical protein EOP04_02875 [Proteobacteria bacterium]|nr:MAG: hypothetical protein EOP04_02875 [Pseudomonadota bacterium]
MENSTTTYVDVIFFDFAQSLFVTKQVDADDLPNVEDALHFLDADLLPLLQDQSEDVAQYLNLSNPSIISTVNPYSRSCYVLADLEFEKSIKYVI